jgi:hypothetical protein
MLFRMGNPQMSTGISGKKSCSAPRGDAKQNGRYPDPDPQVVPTGAKQNEKSPIDENLL